MNYLLSILSINDIIVMILYIVCAQQLNQRVGIMGKKFKGLFSWLIIIQFLLTFLYPILAGFTTDSRLFFGLAQVKVGWGMNGPTGGVDNDFIIFLTAPLVHLFQLSYLGCMYVFSFMGLLGWYFLLKVVYAATKGIWHQWYYILLLPQFHYWTCALGKDSLIFWGICMVIYTWYFHKSFLYYCLPVITIGCIRSPILMLMGGAYSVSFLIKSKASIWVKGAVTCVLFVGAIMLMPVVEKRLGISDLGSAESLQNFVEKQESMNQMGGSALDLQGANIIVKIFSYIFRPLFFDARNVLQLEASFENLVWLCMFIFILKHFKRKYLLWFPTLAFLLMWMAQGSILNNLGVAMRQKMMFFPMFYLLFMQMLYNTKLARNRALNVCRRKN